MTFSYKFSQPTNTRSGERFLISMRRGSAALRHRNYRLFFAGQLVSLVGTWMQTVAQGWLVYQLTDSKFMLGLIAFLGMFPVTLLTVPGGVLADRCDKRRILIGTQLGGMLLAFGLALVAGTDWLAPDQRVWGIASVAVLAGIAHAFDIPTRQSFVVDLVGRDDLANAIALNSTMFNIARIIGPMLAGLLIHWWPAHGIAGCFLLNGLSFLAVILSYSWMQLPPHKPPAAPTPVWDGMRAAIRFVRTEPAVGRIILLVGCFSLLAFPFATLLPAFARDSLRGNASVYSLLGSAHGTGALLGALALAFLGHRIPQRRQFLGGLVGFCIALTGFALSTHLVLSLGLLVVTGWCFIVALATANTAVQHRVPDHLRGSVMGIYTLAFLGTGPLGSLVLGALARWWGAPVAVVTGGMLCLLIVLVMARRTLASPAARP